MFDQDQHNLMAWQTTNLVTQIISGNRSGMNHLLQLF